MYGKVNASHVLCDNFITKRIVWLASTYNSIRLVDEMVIARTYIHITGYDTCRP